MTEDEFETFHAELCERFPGEARQKANAGRRSVLHGLFRGFSLDSCSRHVHTWALKYPDDFKPKLSEIIAAVRKEHYGETQSTWSAADESDFAWKMQQSRRRNVGYTLFQFCADNGLPVPSENQRSRSQGIIRSHIEKDQPVNPQEIENRQADNLKEYLKVQAVREEFQRELKRRKHGKITIATVRPTGGTIENVQSLQKLIGRDSEI